MQKPILIAMSGLPGSGKSALAARLTAALPAVIINIDTVLSAVPPHKRLNTPPPRTILSLVDVPGSGLPTNKMT